MVCGYCYKEDEILRKITIIISIIILLTCCGCNSIINSMDRDNIEYNGRTYERISRNWEMRNPNDYYCKLISYDNDDLSARFYNYDKNNEFIYIENDELLYHSKEFSFPNNKDIEFLSISFIDKEGGPDINDADVIDEFNLIISKKPYSHIKIKKNIASLTIYYDKYPACYFFGNVITDNNDEMWIESNDSKSYYRLSEDSKLFSKCI